MITVDMAKMNKVLIILTNNNIIIIFDLHVLQEQNKTKTAVYREMK